MPNKKMLNIDASSILRERYKFENEQLHKRLSWLASFESFLFAGECIVWDKGPQLVLIIALLGFIIALQGIIAVSMIGMSMINIQKIWVRKNLYQKDDLGVFGIFKESEVSSSVIFPWSEVSIPFFILVAWGAVLYVKLPSYMFLLLITITSIFMIVDLIYLARFSNRSSET